jgi:hypothetical protein
MKISYFIEEKGDQRDIKTSSKWEKLTTQITQNRTKN